MKKGTSFFYTFISIICLALCSCNISLVDTDLMSKPEVDCSDNQVTISIHKINSGTDYINVYRKESDDEEVICGIIFPKELSNKSTLYYFIDSLVKTNKKYQYKVRYHDSKGYHYSAWSDEIKIENINNAYQQDDVLTYSDNNAKFSIDSTDYSISLTAALSAPDAITNFEGNEDEDKDYKPMLVVSTTETDNIKTQLFELDKEFIYNKKIISLRGLLPLDFMDTPIVISGILAQKKEYVNPNETDSAKKITKYICWTEPVNLKMSGYSDNIVTIPSQSGTAGYDYSRHAN